MLRSNSWKLPWKRSLVRWSMLQWWSARSDVLCFLLDQYFRDSMNGPMTFVMITRWSSIKVSWFVVCCLLFLPLLTSLVLPYQWCMSCPSVPPNTAIAGAFLPVVDKFSCHWFVVWRFLTLLCCLLVLPLLTSLVLPYQWCMSGCTVCHICHRWCLPASGG